MQLMHCLLDLPHQGTAQCKITLASSIRPSQEPSSDERFIETRCPWQNHSRRNMTLSNSLICWVVHCSCATRFSAVTLEKSGKTAFAASGPLANFWKPSCDKFPNTKTETIAATNPARDIVTTLRPPSAPPAASCMLANGASILSDAQWKLRKFKLGTTWWAI